MRLLLSFGAALLLAGQLRADQNYTAHAGRVEFTVGSNVPFVKVSGTTSAIVGGGDASVSGDHATVHHLHFEVDPTTFKTGIKLRDQHLYAKVFTASDGRIPKLELRADTFEANLDARNGNWAGDLHAQLTMRGVTRPILFRVSGAMKGNRALLTATSTLSTSAFGVPPIRNAAVTVNDVVKITVVDLELTPANK